MAENLGTGVSYVNDPTGYDYDMVVFQKGKPPLDSELNLIQQIQNDLAMRRLLTLPSGWLSPRPFYTNSLLSNKFYTQDPNTAVPELALVNGSVIHVANTGASTGNSNLITLPDAPTSASQVNGVFLEVWRALLDPSSPANKPPPTTNIDSLADVDAVDTNNAWAVGDNGLVLNTENGGDTWNIQSIDTKYNLNAVYFSNTAIGWVAGNNGTIARTSSGGQLWNLLTSNIVENLNDIFAISQQVAWVVGDAGTILKTTNGINWLPLNSGVNANLRALHFINNQVGWAVGDSGTILITSDGGNNWRLQASGTTTTLNSVRFFDLNTGFAVGNGGVILATQNGGTTWVSQSNRVSTIPAVESHVDGQDVSNQFNGLNNNFTVNPNVPVTRGDGNGTTTNVVADIQVTVNGTEVVITSLVGASGAITLQSAPHLGDLVKVYYWYKNPPQPVTLTSLTADYTDVAMAPSLDEFVNGEEVSGQSNGSNKVFTVLNRPITRGDGNGTVTNVPSDVTVKVNGTTVAVNSLDGLNGQLVLDVAPKLCDTVKVYYWYKVNTSLFRGKVWITGRAGALPNSTISGIVLESDNIGALWTIQNPGTSYDINGIYMANQYSGWIVGQFSLIRNTEDGGYNWSVQKPNVIARQVQRVYPEGNVGATINLLPDDSIHPDVAIETTKRVQIQYKIRIVNDVDPFNFPESGLGSQVVYGLGPNSTGLFAFENMGPINGDYGLWRSKCSNTVDGYSYAIPMFFVARRNSTAYNASNNANGSSKNTSATDTRLDLLTSDNVVSTDILDTRRLINIPSTTELLNSNFEALMDNRLSTRFYRDTVGNDKYGTEILQLDRIEGSIGDGGTLIQNASLGAVATVGLTSSVFLALQSQVQLATGSFPSPVLFPFTGPSTDGLYHQDPSLFTAIYSDSINPNINGTPIPGVFSGLGTNQVTFTFGNGTLTNLGDPNLQYNLNATLVNLSTTALNAVPSEPKLVRNYSDSSSAYYYQGVFEQETSGRIISQWDSGLIGHLNYALAYPQDSTVATAGLSASSVEVHYFVKADSSNSDTSNLSVSRASLQYNVETVTKVNNITSGYSYKIHNVSTTDPLKITSEAGYSFVLGSIYEIVGMVRATAGDTNTKSGATVNFKRAEKTLNSFCVSDILTISNITVNPGDTKTLSLSDGSLSNLNGAIIGVSSTERIPVIPEDSGIILPFCWVEDDIKRMYPIEISSISNFVDIKIHEWTGALYSSGGSPVTISMQVLVRQNQLFYENSGGHAGLMIGYNFKPYQSVADLPASLAIKMIEKPTDIIISDLGTGGSFFSKEPFEQPLINIPVNDVAITNDDFFYNIMPLAFLNISADGGLVQMPAYVPGNTGGEFILTNPSRDNLQRYFYNVCSKEFLFRTEGLQLASPRKIFVGMLGRISGSSDQKLLKGEYVLMVFSRNDFISLENYTGYKANEKCAIALYRLPNRPIARI